MADTGKVLKVLTVDSEGEVRDTWSQQLPADPFSGKYTQDGIQEPPFSLEQMIFLAEQHQTHSAILEQKAADVVGTGWEWRNVEENPVDTKSPDTKKRDELETWFTGLAEDKKTDVTTHEILLAAWLDLETIGQGMIELARDPSGKLRYWYRVPAHTCRFHRDGIRIVQERQGQKVWFKCWVPEDSRVVGSESGNIYKRKSELPKGEKQANEILVLKRPSRRSTWYGIPGYIPATGWIALSTAARDDNLYFFENRREPRWAIILENVDDDPKIEDMLKRALKVDLKKPHRNLIIPLVGEAKINFQPLGDNKGDLSWDKLQERSDGAILLAHRMPGERIGLVRVGALGGSVVSETTRVYKESFVQTSQTLLSARINKLIEVEGPSTDSAKGKGKWIWRPVELDLTEEGEKQDLAIKGFQGGVLTLNESREDVGKDALPEDDERGGKFFFEMAPNQSKQAAESIEGEGEGGKTNGKGPLDLEKSQQLLAKQIESLIEEKTTPSEE